MSALGVPAHSGTGAGASRSSSPSPTNMPTAAWVIDFAMLHEVNVVDAEISISGWKMLAGWVP